jgi:hypothetical protein
LRPVALLWAVAILASACGSRVAEAPSASSPSPTPTATPAASPSPSAKSAAFPDLPFIVGTNAGDLFFQLANGQPAGRKVHACDGAIQHLVAYGRQALFLCGAPNAIPTLSLYDDDAGTVTAIAKTENATFALTDTGQVVYVTVGKTVPSAPISMTKLMVFDLRTGATTTVDERFGVAFELRLTGEGVMVWRPKNSLSFVRPDDEAGTWILHGTALTKLSQFRLIDGGKGRDLLESEPIDPGTGYATSSFCCTYAISKTTAERRLTPPDVQNEKGLALLEDGRMVTWRPDDGEYAGSVVIYNGTTVERMDRGRLGTFHSMRSGDWIVAQEAAPTSALHAYRISDGAFATMPSGGFSTFAFLGPKK